MINFNVMNKLFLQLGSNLGDRVQMIKDATNSINEKLGKVLSVSKIYESDPWRVDGHQNYLNQILEVNSLLSPK